MTTDGATAPPSLSEIAERVDARIEALLSSELARWAPVDDDIVEPLGSLRRFVLAGGKRLRPAFCHWGFVGAGGDPEDGSMLDTAAALELLHSCALIHDDVMDASDRRRGQKTVHNEFEGEHRNEDWRGESRRFGEGVGILVGDLAFVYADVLLGECAPEARQVFNELRLEVNIGQYLDLRGAARGHATLEQARRVCLYKSGKYSVERPLHLGAAQAGRLGELRAPLTRIGLPLGEAFQLRDDLIGAFGDSQATGKPVGGDLREGKPTMLYSLAAERASGPAAKVIDELFGHPDLTLEEVAKLQEVLSETGARQSVEAAVGDRLLEAVSAIEAAPISAEARSELTKLAHFVATRDH